MNGQIVDIYPVAYPETERSESMKIERSGQYGTLLSVPATQPKQRFSECNKQHSLERLTTLTTNKLMLRCNALAHSPPCIRQATNRSFNQRHRREG